MKKKLKINFLSHLNPFHYHGGGEQITNAIIREGRERGHDIKVIAMKPKKFRLTSRVLKHRIPDLWLLFDVFNCPEAKDHFARGFIDSIISTGKYVIGQNAYSDICYLNALPCNGQTGDGRKCVVTKDDYYGKFGNSSGWKNGYCPVSDNKRLFTNALECIFLSPLHASVFETIYPEITDKTYILKPLVDVELFTDKKGTRDIKYASYGGMSETKGFYNIRAKFPDEHVVFFGSRGEHLAENYNYGEVIGRIPYEEMPDFLNRVENYIHMPRWPEPHGLIINQAALSGCNLILNDMVGATTHETDPADRAGYENNASEFWVHLEEVAKRTKEMNKG